MGLSSVILLAGAGLVAGFLAGLVGVGGGLIFAPVLFFYFSHIGVPPEIVAQLTLGSSLFCALIATSAGAVVHVRNGAVELRTAVTVGLLSAVAVALMTHFVTTKSWYDGQVFQVVFSLVLLGVVAGMLKEQDTSDALPHDTRHPWPKLLSMGSAAGVLSAAAGVGGGVVLVPAYHNLLRFPMKRAVGTSAASIVVISLAGVVNYALLGWDAPTPSASVGFVDVGHSAILAGASILSANLGARTAHRLPSRVLRWSFALLALLIATRLLVGALRS